MAYRIFSIDEIKAHGYVHILTIHEWPSDVILQDVARLNGHQLANISAFRTAPPEVYGIFYRPDHVHPHYPVGELWLEDIAMVLTEQHN